MYKRMVRCYSIDESINQFTIGYTIKPLLQFNMVFRQQLEKCLRATFHERKMKTIKCCLRKNNTCVMALIMFYENNLLKPKKSYRVLSCLLYSLIDNYVCIDYLSCQ